MTSTPELICTYLTLAGNIGPLDSKAVSPVSLAERAEAAGAAGYRGLVLAALHWFDPRQQQRPGRRP